MGRNWRKEFMPRIDMATTHRKRSLARSQRLKSRILGDDSIALFYATCGAMEDDAPMSSSLLKRIHPFPETRVKLELIHPSCHPAPIITLNAGRKWDDDGCGAPQMGESISHQPGSDHFFSLHEKIPYFSHLTSHISRQFHPPSTQLLTYSHR